MSSRLLFHSRLISGTTRSSKTRSALSSNQICQCKNETRCIGKRDGYVSKRFGRDNDYLFGFLGVFPSRRDFRVRATNIPFAARLGTRRSASCAYRVLMDRSGDISRDSPERPLSRLFFTFARFRSFESQSDGRTKAPSVRFEVFIRSAKAKNLSLCSCSSIG